jgi:PAS domain S-box-containing protein
MQFLDEPALSNDSDDVDRLLFVANAVPALIAYVDPQSQYVWANESYRRWFGSPPEQLRGRHVSEVLGSAAWERVRPYIERVLSGEAVTFDDRLIYKSGPARAVRAAYVPHMDARGRVRGFVGLVNDITEIRAAELALRRSEHMLEQSQSMAHVGSWEVTFSEPDGADSIRWSDETYRIFGFDPRTAVSRALFLEAVHEEDRGAALVLRETAQERKAGDRVEKEFRIVRPDGTVRSIQAWARFEHDGAGSPIRMVGTCQDITDRRRAEDDTRQARAQLQLVMDSTAATIARYDRACRIVWSNRSNAARFGKTPEQIVGRPLREVEGEAAYLALRESIDRVLTGETVRLEVQVPYQELGLRWIDLVYSPTFDLGGAVDGWVSVTTDNTHRHELEQALRLSEERALRELREADRRKDEFLAMLSHELRNPLAPILHAVEILDRAGPDREKLAPRYRTVIAQQVQHMKRLLDDLLDVSRVSQGKIQLRKEPVELGALLLQAIEVSRPMIIEKEQQLTVTLAQEPLPMEADPARLVQVFANLLNNASKYTDRRGHISLTAGVEDRDAVIKVRDDGVGMSSDMQEQVFDLFVQEPRSLDRAQGGLGIGLTMVRTLVKMHGGGVRAISDGPGRGSELVVTLPLAAGLRTSAPRARGLREGANGRPLRLLVVDDNVEAAQTLRELLELLGHHVALAEDGPGALRAAAATFPELVLLDLGLPGMDGYAVAARLREAGHRHAVLVALTGYGQERDRQRSKEAGLDHHLVKPVDLDVLEEILEQLQKDAERPPG